VCVCVQLMVHYCLPEFSDVTDFLALLAKRRGMLKKGGRPNINKAAKLVLHDWNTSVLPVCYYYYSESASVAVDSSHVSRIL